MINFNDYRQNRDEEIDKVIIKNEEIGLNLFKFE